MRLYHFVRPVLALAVAGGAAFGAYATRTAWLPYVFPPTAEKPRDDHDGHDHDPEEAPRVKLSPQAQRNLGLEAGELTPREYWRSVPIPGLVVDRPGESDRRVAARVAGVVTGVRARLGATVRPGEELFTIQLTGELLQVTQAELARAAVDLAFAAAERDRVAGLVKLGTTPASELARHQNLADRAGNQVRAARRQLQALGLTPEQVAGAERGEAVTEVKVTAPGVPGPASAFPGSDRDEGDLEVRSINVSRGDHVQAGQVLCQLADHRHLLVEGSAFKSEGRAVAAAAANKLPVAAEFADETPGDWPGGVALTVAALSEHVDPVSRTFAFYLELPNRFDAGVWRFSPGQRVRLRLPVERLATPRADGKVADPFVLPAGAVVREGADAFVFVKVEDVFVRRPVRVLHEDGTEVVIANDGSVTRADTVVRNKAAALNRAVKAAAGGHDHGHDHDH